MQFVLEFQTTHAGHTQIADDATFDASQILIEKLDRTFKNLVREIDRFDQIDQQKSHHRIIIDQVDLGFAPRSQL